MKRVYKYPLYVPMKNSGSPLTDILMPKNAKVVHVGLQEGVVTIWAEVDDDALQAAVSGREWDGRRFAVYGTGDTIPDDDAVHVGSLMDGIFVWHVYETPSR